MEQYLYETHCHSSQCSRCAYSSSRELVRAYRAAGYAGLVLTDHFIFGNTAVDQSLPWPERMGAYYDAYLEARDEGEPLDFDVIFGIEHNYGHGKEILIYGLELDFLLANPDIPELSPEDFVRRVHDAGGLAIHAHPYRDRPYIDMSVGPRADIVDGAEIYNACSRPGEDRQALDLASGRGGWILTSGGDIHNAADSRIGAAGIWLPRRVKTSAEFAAALAQRQHRFRVRGRDLDQVRPEDLP